MRLAELRGSDPQAYLEEVKSFDEERWFEELPALDPDAFAEEQARRIAIEQAERIAQCSDGKASLAYVMIQDDVRRSLRAPSTAEFPGRYSTGTVHLGNCIYQVVGTFDAQNGIGAMIRGRFVGTKEYFPDTKSWQTRSLDVQG
ncbi:hypothetical protein [Maritimibacter alkaliphilus]|uniref:hypothetical protein n=1 Tax=Maritimibacter alkaliphilus TaxID=404236 RepID=UPI001C95D5A1|nr:hypothetical protein [Maritimibacter alkaliphilus]MBY6090483.1 hypothetical protein [Maritimibacter alkaliphilus]